MVDTAARAAGLGKQFGSVWALTELDLDVIRGEVLGYLGPNGAGKTTTLRLLLGSLRPSTGRVEIFGVDGTRSVAAAHRRVAYVPGEVELWPSLTGGETLDLLGRLHGTVDQRYREELVERFDVDPARRVRDCSKGNRQKLALVAALMTRADLLLLDEPTSGLDPLKAQEFRVCINEAKSRGQTVMLSSHLLAEVEALSDRIALLRAGRLVDLGTLAELRHLSSTVVEVQFGQTPPDVGRLPGVNSVLVRGRTVQCHVHGDLQPLLRLLGEHRVTSLISRQPSLEEIFLGHYGAEPLPAVPIGPTDGVLSEVGSGG